MPQTQPKPNARTLEARRRALAKLARRDPALAPGISYVAQAVAANA